MSKLQVKLPVEHLNFKELNKIERKKLLDFARIAEIAERYRDMCLFMNTIVQQSVDGGKDEKLNLNERNLLSVAYKNVVGSLRQSWRAMGKTDDNDATKAANFNKFKKYVETKLGSVCVEVIDLLTKGPLKVELSKEQDVKGVKEGDEQAEDTVFFLKMCGDYYRYLAEFNNDEKYKTETKNFYERAFNLSKACLPETHPTRLGLALNFSVCYYEILKKPDEACKLAKEAFDAAIEKLDTLNDESYKDSTLIMQLLRDNLTLWTSEENNDKGDDADQA